MNIIVHVDNDIVFVRPLELIVRSEPAIKYKRSSELADGGVEQHPVQEVQLEELLTNINKLTELDGNLCKCKCTSGNSKKTNHAHCKPQRALLQILNEPRALSKGFGYEMLKYAKTSPEACRYTLVNTHTHTHSHIPNMLFDLKHPQIQLKYCSSSFTEPSLAKPALTRT
jgi:hypothetical protein